MPGTAAVVVARGAGRRIEGPAGGPLTFKVRGEHAGGVRFREPSAGLEPATPSFPWKPFRARSPTDFQRFLWPPRWRNVAHFAGFQRGCVALVFHGVAGTTIRCTPQSRRFRRRSRYREGQPCSRPNCLQGARFRSDTSGHATTRFVPTVPTLLPTGRAARRPRHVGAHHARAVRSHCPWRAAPPRDAPRHGRGGYGRRARHARPSGDRRATQRPPGRRR
jgi:hypothetical protein